MCTRGPAGYSLVELLFAMSLVVTLSGVAVPELQGALDDSRTAGAARYVATRVQRARMEAISRSANVAIQFVQMSSGYSYGMYVDGNGDGVRTLDINKAIDRPLGAAERLPANFSGVEFGVLPGLPPVDAGGTAPGTDPIKLGTSNLLSFSALGTSSSGSVYVRGRNNAQYVIRVFGETGRTRVLKFDVRTRTWQAV
jgi:type II secretory pathway pseudopilin PulG